MSRRFDWRKYLFISCFLLPGIALYTVFVIYPALDGLRLSFMDWKGLDVTQRTWAGFANYGRLAFELTDAADLYKIRRYLSNNIFLFFFSLFDFLFAFVVAYILTRKPRGANLFRVVYFFPSILSTAAIVIMWSMVLNPRHGLLNQALRAVGLGDLAQPWFSQATMWPFAPIILYSLAIIGIWGAMGSTMLLFIAAIQNIPNELYEAARMDGANEFQNFYLMTVPLVWEMFKTLLVFRAIGIFGQFTTIHILTAQEGSAGGGNGWFIANYFYYQAFTAHNWGYASAIIVAVLVISLVLAGITFRMTKREAVTY